MDSLWVCRLKVRRPDHGTNSDGFLHRKTTPGLVKTRMGYAERLDAPLLSHLIGGAYFRLGGIDPPQRCRGLLVSMINFSIEYFHLYVNTVVLDEGRGCWIERLKRLHDVKDNNRAIC